MTKTFRATSLLLVIAGLGCDRPRREATAHSQPDYFAKKRECFELAAKREAHQDKEAATEEARKPSPSRNFYYLRPETCYVPPMNTCIYESGFTEAASGKPIMTTEDLLTGRVIVATVSEGEEDYKRERDRLFSLCAK
jgi:hypothetical protein